MFGMVSSRLVTRRVLCFVGCLIAIVAAVAVADVEVETSDPCLRLDLPGHTGPVRALAFVGDGSRLVSGGEDKLAMLWRLPAVGGGVDGLRERDVIVRRRRERVFRWQVARGDRGAIKAIAVAPAASATTAAGPLVAMAGHGVMGSTGEILIVDARDGSRVATLGGGNREGHVKEISALSFTSDGRWLVSRDKSGRCFAWQRGDDWRPHEVCPSDDVAGVFPVATTADSVAVVPRLAAQQPFTKPTKYELELVDLSQPKTRKRIATPHWGSVRSLAATKSVVASCDFESSVKLFEGPHFEAVCCEINLREVFGKDIRLAVADSMALSVNGTLLAAGCLGVGGISQPFQYRLVVWDVSEAEAKIVHQQTVNDRVWAVALSGDGTRVAWSGGAKHVVSVAAVGDDKTFGRPLALGGVGQTITRVAFATTAASEGLRQRDVVRKHVPRGRSTAPRRIAISRLPRSDEAPAQFDAAFDAEDLAIFDAGRDSEWARSDGQRGSWDLERSQAEGWQLRHSGRLAGTVDLDEDWQGDIGDAGRAIAWIAPDGVDEPSAVALGTQKGIFVYGLRENGACELLRRYRGHEGGVTSLAVSEDGAWLASGGTDGLVMLWPLQRLFDADAMWQRWGVKVAVRDGAAVVEDIDAAGPLAGKDVRRGDVIVKIGWRLVDGDVVHSTPEKIVAALPAVPWNAQVDFQVERMKQEFLRFPAWENLSAFHLEGQEWAYWTPQGYYAASANGDRLFGWLVNRGLDRLPRFFRAEQFRQKLERPNVVSQLLVQGSLAAALENADGEVPVSSAAVLGEQIAATPEVRLLLPSPMEPLRGDRTTVRAEVVVPSGVELDRVRAFASGVASTDVPRVVEEVAAGQRIRRVYEAEMRLPEGDSHLVSVLVTTRDGPTSGDEGDFEYQDRDQDRPPPRRRRKIYVVAAGVDRYASIGQLFFAVKDAETLTEALRSQSSDLYDVGRVLVLKDEEVTREGWTTTIGAFVEEIRGDVEPNDLVVLFLAGHGEQSDRGYRYLCFDAPEMIAPDNPNAGTIGWDELEGLADLPCQKLALIDTCHSGALSERQVASTGSRDLTANHIVVLAAAAENEKSLEDDDLGHGLFTKVLLDGLAGAANASSSAASEPPDQIVSLNELVDYVTSEVPKIAKPRGGTQTPQVSPARLLPYLRAPLTSLQP